MDIKESKHFVDSSGKKPPDGPKHSDRMAFQCLVWISSILCIAQVWSKPTRCQLRRDLVVDTHKLLETLAGPLPFQCLDDKVDIKFPSSALLSNDSKQDVGVAMAVYKTLTNVDSLFLNDGVPQYWDQQKLEEFQGLVYRQIEESKCILEKVQEDQNDFSVRNATLSEYFETLGKHLEDKEFSTCAWEMVRNDLLRILQFILLEISNNEFFVNRA